MRPCDLQILIHWDFDSVKLTLRLRIVEGVVCGKPYRNCWDCWHCQWEFYKYTHVVELNILMRTKQRVTRRTILIMRIDFWPIVVYCDINNFLQYFYIHINNEKRLERPGGYNVWWYEKGHPGHGNKLEHHWIIKLLSHCGLWREDTEIQGAQWNPNGISHIELFYWLIFSH